MCAPNGEVKSVIRPVMNQSGRTLLSGTLTRLIKVGLNQYLCTEHISS